MKRMHIHISVDDLASSIGFYSTMFGAQPSILHDDYAKWDLTDPAVNFAISNRGQAIGVNHLGIQVDSEAELDEIAQRLTAAEIHSSEQSGAACCYVRSNKHWAMDPQGIAWESFHSLGAIPVFGEDATRAADAESSACCIPLKLDEQVDDSDAACCIPKQEEAGGCCS